MTGATQLALPVEPALPLDPHVLLDLPADARGRYYAAVDLDLHQAGCAEEAIRMITAGIYQGGKERGV
jgi:hypothetical protein